MSTELELAHSPPPETIIAFYNKEVVSYINTMWLSSKDPAYLTMVG